MSLKKYFKRMILFGLASTATYFAYVNFPRDSGNYVPKNYVERQLVALNDFIVDKILEDDLHYTRSLSNSNYVLNVSGASKINSHLDRLMGDMYIAFVKGRLAASKNYLEDIITENDSYVLANSSNITNNLSAASITNVVNYWLNNVDHIDRVNAVDILKSTNVNTCSLTEKVRLYNILNSLHDTTFCNNLGQLIVKDVNDIYAEHGGVFIFDEDHKFTFRELPGTLERLRDNNDQYDGDISNFTSSYVAPFHIHATKYDDSKFAGPSSPDLDYPKYVLDLTGKSYEFVITSISRGKFNIDYYGGDSSISSTLHLIDLGIYNYSLAIDTTSSIKKESLIENLK